MTYIYICQVQFLFFDQDIRKLVSHFCLPWEITEPVLVFENSVKRRRREKISLNSILCHFTFSYILDLQAHTCFNPIHMWESRPINRTYEVQSIQRTSSWWDMNWGRANPHYQSKQCLSNIIHLKHNGRPETVTWGERFRSNESFFYLQMRTQIRYISSISAFDHLWWENSKEGGVITLVLQMLNGI